MDELEEKLTVASRPNLLRFIAEGIHGFTIMARDPEMDETRKATINNRIHYLAGHMMRLLDPHSTLKECQLNDITAQAGALNAMLVRKMIERLES